MYFNRLKKSNKCICFINKKARLFCDAPPRLHVMRNNVGKGHAWRRQKYRVGVYKLNVQILSQTPLTKKGNNNSPSFQGKPTMSDDFELGGEDEMDPTSSFSMSLRITWSLGCALQNRWAIVFIKHIYIYIYIYTCFFFMTDCFAR